LVAAARTNNFDLQTRRVELEQQGFRVLLSRKDGYPAISVGPYFSEERAGDREQQVGIGISIPVPLWNRNKGNIETAQARLKQAETLRGCRWRRHHEHYARLRDGADARNRYSHGGGSACP